MRDLYLCGAGNPEGVRLALLLNESQRRWRRIAVLDDDPAQLGRRILGVEVEGPFSRLGDALSVNAAGAEVVNLVSRTTRGRAAAREKIASYGLPFAALIHPSVATDGVELPRDVLVFQNATLGAESSLEDGVAVLMGGVVGHESRVGPCCVIAPGGVINARVVLEEGVYIGTNAAVLPELTVRAWATVGACSMVTQDVPAEASVVGVPGRALMLRKPEGSGPPRTAATAGSAERGGGKEDPR